MGHRTPLLIHCSVDEAAKIRDSALRERRTFSSYTLNILMRAVQLDENLARMRGANISADPYTEVLELYGLSVAFSRRPTGPRTTMLIWCSTQESKRIRGAAKRRDVTISGFVLHTLRSFWKRRRATLVDESIFSAKRSALAPSRKSR